MKYFAYGADLHAMRKLLRGKAKQAKAACIDNAKMTFPRYDERWMGGTASFAEAGMHKVWGAVFELTGRQMKELDASHGCTGDAESEPYSRVMADVRGEDGRRIMGVYTHRANAQPGSYYPPSREYIDAIEKGAKEYKLPASFFAELTGMLARL